jgi:hypothetical protein
MNFLGSPPDYAFYYALTIGVEVLILAFILRAAWTWPRTSSASTPEPDTTDLNGRDKEREISSSKA